MNKIRVLLVSDFVLLRAGLRALLADSPNVEVVGETADEDDIKARIEELTPNVVILAISRDEEDVFKTIQDLVPARQVVAVSPIQDPKFVMRLLRAGVHGYVSNQEALVELVRAMDAVAQGEVFLCPSASKALLSEYRKGVIYADPSSV
jgi:DNA-binding NarL/FixJ family response regulator